MLHSVKSFIILVTGGIVISHTCAQQLAEQKIQSYSSCQTDADCKVNSFCYGNDDNLRGKCKCIDGYELIRNSTFYECLEARKLGDACEKDIQCQFIATKLAFCNDSQLCECNSDSHNFNGKCFLKIKLGDICMNDGNCYIDDGTPDGGLAFCDQGRCTCRYDQRPSEDRTKCLTSRKLGEVCIADEECTTANARCLETCRCGTEYTLARNESSCVKAAQKFGEACDFDGQCSKFLLESICNSGLCGCQAGFHEYGIRCVETKKLSERCTDDAQCMYEKKLVDNVKCQQGTCQCLFGTTGDGSCKIEKNVDDDNSSVSRFQDIPYISALLIFILMRI